VTSDQTGNLPPLPGIFPDYPAPTVRAAEGGGRELVMARWGMPSSKKALLDSATRRADKERAKGKDVDFVDLRAPLRRRPSRLGHDGDDYDHEGKGAQKVKGALLLARHVEGQRQHRNGSEEQEGR
jgi:hypothetical protein